jgi:hypothetical protein
MRLYPTNSLWFISCVTSSIGVTTVSAYYSLLTRASQPNHLIHRAGRCIEAGQADLDPPQGAVRQSDSMQLGLPMHKGRRRPQLRPTQAQHSNVTGSKLRATLLHYPTSAHVLALYPASVCSHMTTSVRGVPCSKFQRPGILSSDVCHRWATFLVVFCCQLGRKT